jgi:hypothetical protein
MLLLLFLNEAASASAVCCWLLILRKRGLQPPGVNSSSGKNPVQWEKYRTIEKNARFSLERPVREQLGSEFADREGAGCLIVLSINQSSAWPGFELLRKKSISPRKVSLLRDSG